MPTPTTRIDPADMLEVEPLTVVFGLCVALGIHYLLRRPRPPKRSISYTNQSTLLDGKFTWTVAAGLIAA